MTNQSLYEQASDVLVGGVNSPVRAYKAVGGDPIFMRSGKGAMITDAFGNSYIDYVLSYGPLLAGHAPETVISDIHNALIKGTTFGAPNVKETQLASAIRELIPSCEKIRLVNSGTEATMSAIRLARGVTKRDILIKFDGCYHGHVDALLVSAGSGALTLGTPSSAGIPESITQHTHVLPFNDSDALESCFRDIGSSVAAVIIEPVCGNMGVVLPQNNFLTRCRDLCDQYGVCLIFDEVMTGFRASQYAAQHAFNVTPDITCLGKVIGGGLPCAAYGGSADIMNALAPLGSVYQAGTLSGNPLAVTAGLSMLQLIKAYNVLDCAIDYASTLVAGMIDQVRAINAPIQINHIGTMFTVFFTNQPIQNLDDVKACDSEQFKRYFHFMKDRGILIPPSQFEANFVSSKHDARIIEQTLRVFKDFLTTYYG